MQGFASVPAFAAVPYWRLSAFYFFYFALLGVIVPYWSLYLQSLQFTPRQIGIVSAILMASRVIAPNIWGWLSERSGRRLTVIRAGALCACLSFTLLFWRTDFIWVCVVVAAFSFFWNAILAQFEVVTLSHLSGLSHYYSRIRLWGSIGFIVLAVLLGVLYQWYSISTLPVVIVLILTAIWLSSLAVPESRQRQHEPEHGQKFWDKINHFPVACFLLAAFFLQVSHGSYYTFYSIYLEQLSYSRTTIGLLWGLAVVAEVAVFWFMHHLVQLLGPRTIMLATLALTILRWLLIGYFADYAGVILFAQLLHAFSFGTAHAVSIELVRRFFRGRHQGQGQALLSAVSFGAGGACGALISGFVWEVSPSATFAISAVAAGCALALVWVGLRGDACEKPDALE